MKKQEMVDELVFLRRLFIEAAKNKEISRKTAIRRINELTIEIETIIRTNKD